MAEELKLGGCLGLAEFRYRAYNVGGKVVHGKIAAPDKLHVVNSLFSEGLYVASVRQIGGVTSLGARLTGLFRRSREASPGIGLHHLAFFCRQLATMVSSGIPVLESLRAIAGQKIDKRLKRAVSGVAEAVVRGKGLSTAFAEVRPRFPRLMVSMVEAGEAGGILEEVLERLALHFEREHGVRRKIAMAMIYPALVSVVAVGVVVLLVTVVVPNFTILFGQIGAALPLPTRALIALSRFLGTNWISVFLGIVVLTVAVTGFSRTTSGHYTMSRAMTHIPVFGDLVVKIALMRFTRTLGSLLKSGIDILEALGVVREAVANPVFARAVDMARQAVTEGESLGHSLRRTRLFPAMVTEMVDVGEESGRLPEMLDKVATFYEREIERKTDQLSALIEPFIIVILGAVVGFVMVSLITPMYDVLSKIQ